MGLGATNFFNCTLAILMDELIHFRQSELALGDLTWTFKIFSRSLPTSEKWIPFKVCVLVLSSTRKAFRVFRNLFSYVQNNTWSISWACRFISLPSIPFQLRDRVWVELLYLCACLTTITTHFGVRCTKTQRPGTATHHINSHSTNPAISSGARLHYACLALHAASGGTVRHSTLDNAKCQGGAPA